MRIKKDHINFAVGPVQISEEIGRIGSEPVPYFRTDEFSALMLENEQLFKDLIGAGQDARVVFLTGSGTAAMEAAVVGCFTEEDKLLVINGGSFGQRFCEICKLHGLRYDTVKLEYGKTLHREQLYAYAGQGYSGLLVNMGETTTGVLYDVEMIGQFCKENGIFLVVDAVSSFLADRLDMKEAGIDVVLTGAQKALALPPGISIVALSENACGRISRIRPKSYYLDLQNALKNGERGQTPFTPAVGILIQLNARLNQIMDNGPERERKRIEDRAYVFRQKIPQYHLRLYAETPSNAVTALTPENPEISARKIFEILKDEYGIIVCPNGGDLAERIFRVGHIGAQTEADYAALYQAFDALMKRGIL